MEETNEHSSVKEKVHFWEKNEKRNLLMWKFKERFNLPYCAVIFWAINVLIPCAIISVRPSSTYDGIILVDFLKFQCFHEL